MVLVASTMAVAKKYVCPHRRDRDVPAGLRQSLSLGKHALSLVSYFYITCQPSRIYHCEQRNNLYYTWLEFYISQSLYSCAGVNSDQIGIAIL